MYIIFLQNAWILYEIGLGFILGIGTNYVWYKFVISPLFDGIELL